MGSYFPELGTKLSPPALASNHSLDHQGSPRMNSWPAPCKVASVMSKSFCDPMDCSPLDSSHHGILRARILEWVAMLSSRGSSWPRDWTRTSYISCIEADSLPLVPLGELLNELEMNKVLSNLWYLCFWYVMLYKKNEKLKIIIVEISKITVKYHAWNVLPQIMLSATDCRVMISHCLINSFINYLLSSYFV